MSKSSKGPTGEPRAESALDARSLARYRQHSRAPDLGRDLRNVTKFGEDYAALSKAGEVIPAIGAGLELVDLGLRIAATPSPSGHDLGRKVEFLGCFGPLVRSFSHGHVAAIAEAAVRAERALDAGHRLERRVPRSRRTSGTTAGRGGEAPTAADPGAPMLAYADGAGQLGDMYGVIAVLRQICADRETLAREGRHRDALGADHLVAGMARRICATAAWSAQSAEHKVAALAAVREDLLATDRPYRPKGIEGALMAAMIDCAVDVETRAWHVTRTRH